MPYNVAIVGAGIGASHAAAYSALPERFSLKIVCDLDRDRGAPLAKKYGADYEANLTAVFANADIDIVDICLPPHIHFRACMDALEAGKTVICEKPLVSSLKDADALAKKSVETGYSIYPVFQYRFGLGAAQLHALMDAGLAGRCYAGTLETHWNRPASYYDIDWRGTWAGEQGGAILGHAIHIHDLLSAFLGPVKKVYASLDTRVNDIEVEDCAALSITMEEGALVTSSVTLGCAENISRMRLMFEGFTFQSDQAPYSLAEKAWCFVAREPTKQAKIDAVLANVEYAGVGYEGMFAAIDDAMAGRGGREVTFADGRRSLEFVTAVYASARSGEAVLLPLEKDHPLYAGWIP